MSNLKSVSSTVLELLALNAQTFRGHATLATHSFRKNFKDRVQTDSENMHVKLEVRSFNRFGAISI